MNETDWRALKMHLDDIGRRIDEGVMQRAALMIALRCLLEHHRRSADCHKQLQAYLALMQDQRAILAGDGKQTHERIKASIEWILGSRESMP